MSLNDKKLGLKKLPIAVDWTGKTIETMKRVTR